MARILVVDDDTEQLALRRLILRKHGYEVTGAANAVEALRLCGEIEPRCVLMDLRMPTAEDGLALIRDIRQSRPQTDVLVLTGWADDIEGKPERSMVNGVFVKPVKIERLLAALGRLVALALAFIPAGVAWAQTPARFRVADAKSEIIAAITMTARGADWGRKGSEGVLARVLVDGRARGHAWVFGEAQGEPVKVFLGRLAAGEHTLAVEPVKAQSAALPFEAGRVEVMEIAPSDSRYEAVANAPIVIARADTAGRFSDVPMIAYFERGKGTYRYTVIFTNEDGGTSTRDLMARWGRTTDIEFVYEVNPATKATLIQAKGHKEIPYTGSYEGRHPSLEVVTTNNMVAPGEAAGKLDFRLLPELIELTGSREVFMDRHAWTYAVASKELEREGKLRKFGEVREETISDPRSYLVAELNSVPENSGLQVVAKLRGGDGRYGSARGIPENYITRPGWLRIAVELPPGTAMKDITEMLLDCVVTPDLKERKGVRDGTCGLASPGRVMLLGADYRPNEWRTIAAPGRWRAGTMVRLETRP
jgi:CheY-like chemotaxis protein